MKLLTCHLGMGDWTDEPEETSVQPPPPKKRLRLSLGKEAPLRETTNRRFAGPVSTGELENAAKGVVPANTAASTQWAVKNFESWARSRPSSSTDAVPSDLLMSHDADLVSKWLCRFVLETRKTDGTRYPPATLRSLVSGLNRELKRNKAPFSVLDKSDARFRDLDSISPLKASQELSVVVHFTFPTTDLSLSAFV